VERRGGVTERESANLARSATEPVYCAVERKGLQGGGTSEGHAQQQVRTGEGASAQSVLVAAALVSIIDRARVRGMWCRQRQRAGVLLIKVSSCVFFGIVTDSAPGHCSRTVQSGSHSCSTGLITVRK